MHKIWNLIDDNRTSNYCLIFLYRGFFQTFCHKTLNFLQSKITFWYQIITIGRRHPYEEFLWLGSKIQLKNKVPSLSNHIQEVAIWRILFKAIEAVLLHTSVVWGSPTKEENLLFFLVLWETLGRRQHICVELGLCIHCCQNAYPWSYSLYQMLRKKICPCSESDLHVKHRILVWIFSFSFLFWIVSE